MRKEVGRLVRRDVMASRASGPQSVRSHDVDVRHSRQVGSDPKDCAIFLPSHACLKTPAITSVPLTPLITD